MFEFNHDKSITVTAEITFSFCRDGILHHSKEDNIDCQGKSIGKLWLFTLRTQYIFHVNSKFVISKQNINI